jgi:hypothetical protein
VLWGMGQSRRGGGRSLVAMTPTRAAGVLGVMVA